MPMTPKEMIKFLKKHGFKEVKGEGKGGHQKVRHEDKRQTTVPIHNRDLTKDEEHKILKQAGLLEEYRKK